MAINDLVEVMADGIREHERLLAVALPRVSSESLAVAIAAESLLRHHHASLQQDEEPTLEALIERKRRDLIVIDKTGRYDFEFKSLWPGGCRRVRAGDGVPECPRGILADLNKLRDLPRGYAVAFSYVLHEVPPKSALRHFDEFPTVDRLIEAAVKYIRRQPDAQSKVVPVNGLGCRADACFVAWSAQPAI